MKKISSLLMSIFIGLTFSSLANAVDFSCSSDFAVSDGRDYAAGVMDVINVSCSDGYSISVDGIGLGLRYAAGGAYAVSCPGVDDPQGKYYGVNVSCDLMFGLCTGLFVGKNGVCAMGGIKAGSIGASISGAVLTISR